MAVGKVVPVGRDTYRIQEIEPLGTADERAKRTANDFCKKTNKAMRITSGTFDLGTGVILDFICVAPEERGHVVQAGRDAYRIWVDEAPPSVAEAHAKQMATEYCRKTNKGMLAKDRSAYDDDGLFLTFACVPPQQAADQQP